MMIFTQDQLNSIDDFFSTFDDLNKLEEALYELYDAYMASSNDENGKIPIDIMRQQFFMVRELIKLLRKIKPREEVDPSGTAGTYLKIG